jgi:hypothetical protein
MIRDAAIFLSGGLTALVIFAGIMVKVRRPWR